MNEVTTAFDFPFLKVIRATRVPLLIPTDGVNTIPRLNVCPQRFIAKSHDGRQYL